MRAFNKRKRPKHITKGKYMLLGFIQHNTKGKEKTPHFKWRNVCDEWSEVYLRTLRTHRFFISNFI